MKAHISAMGWYWLAWIVLGFGIPEAYGLIFNAGDTLSENVWGFEDYNPWHPTVLADWTWLHLTLAGFMLVFMVWLFCHLIFGIWR
jgi:hypothetical protein